jgi:hypothetical protein
MLDVDQAGELKRAFRRGDWTNAEVKKLSEGDILAQVRMVVRGLAEIQIVKRLLQLAQSFNPAEFIGSGWTVWKGPADGDGLEGEEDRDLREDALTELDLANLMFETCLEEGESRITGEVKLERLKKAGKTRLGGRFLALWQNYEKNKGDSLLEYLHKTRKLTYLDFFGLVLRSSDGCRYVPFFYRSDGGSWHWDCKWLINVWDRGDVSAGLAS